MKKGLCLYPLLDGVFHVFHVATITFIMFGWLFAPLRPAHLILVILTLGSWFILGLWLGTGYCPISDWHWKIKEYLGDGAPEGTYIQQLLQHITGREFNAAAVDKAVTVATIVIAVVSLGLNLNDWFGANQ